MTIHAGHITRMINELVKYRLEPYRFRIENLEKPRFLNDISSGSSYTGRYYPASRQGLVTIYWEIHSDAQHEVRMVVAPT